MSDTDTTATLARDMVRLDSRGRGFCPAHYGTELACGSWCVRQRAEWVQVCADFDEYWRSTAMHRLWLERMRGVA